MIEVYLLYGSQLSRERVISCPANQGFILRAAKCYRSPPSLQQLRGDNKLGKSFTLHSGKDYNGSPGTAIRKICTAALRIYQIFAKLKPHKMCPARSRKSRDDVQAARSQSAVIKLSARARGTGLPTATSFLHPTPPLKAEPLIHIGIHIYIYSCEWVGSNWTRESADLHHNEMKESCLMLLFSEREREPDAKRL